MSAALRPPIGTSRAWGYVCAGLVVLLWAGFSLSGRYAAVAAGPRLTPWDLAALRFMVTLPVGLAAYAAGPARGLPPRRAAAVAVVAGLCFPLPAYVGFGLAPVAHSAVILSGALPFLVAGFLALTGTERFGREKVASLLVLLLGIALLADSAFAGSTRSDAWRGDLLFLAAATAWAWFTVLARRWSLTPWQVVGTCGVWAGLPYLAVWAVALPSHLGQVPIGAVAFQMIMQGLLITVVSVLLYTRAIALLGPARVSLVTALVPGLAGLLALPLLGEAAGALDLAGLALVTAAVALGVRRRQSE